GRRRRGGTGGGLVVRNTGIHAGLLVGQVSSVNGAGDACGLMQIKVGASGGLGHCIIRHCGTTIQQ
ncbi:MAG: hypothetical protein KGL43_20250, partial [Burkholderiales bacterium]|nr:hypothetical protein [Burkholderiales bacterium]